MFWQWAMWELTAKEDIWRVPVQDRHPDSLSVQGRMWGRCVEAFQFRALSICVFQISHWTYNSEDHRDFLECNSKTKSHQQMLHRSRCLIVWRHHQQPCMPPAPIKTHPVPLPSLFYMGFLPPFSSWPSLTHAHLMISLIPKLNFPDPAWNSPCWWGI